jgi:hypothetical protein
VFNHNHFGLEIFSTGKITVNKLEASNNLDVGADLYNQDADVPAGVNITGWVYVDNDTQGLFVLSKGAITIANLNINNGSAEYGVHLSTEGNVTVSGASQIYNCINWGLTIYTNGIVTLSNMTVSGNGAGGVYINTKFGGTATPQKVILTGSNTFWDNGSDGLVITTYGTIAISNIDAYNNGGNGVYLDNCGARDNGNACDSSLLLAPKGITITGANFFESNGQDGLFAVSYGAISVSNLHSIKNTAK